MDDIRFIEAEGDFLVLESTDGQRFRLLADDPEIGSDIRRLGTVAKGASVGRAKPGRVGGRGESP